MAYEENIRSPHISSHCRYNTLTPADRLPDRKFNGRMKRFVISILNIIFCRLRIVFAILIFPVFNLSAQPEVLLSWPLTSGDQIQISSDKAYTGFSHGKATDQLIFDGYYGAMSGGWNTAGLDSDAYYEYTIAPVEGTGLTILRVQLEISLGRGEMYTVLKYSLDGFRNHEQQIDQPKFFYTTIPQSLSQAANITVNYPDTLSIRVYAWGAGDRFTEFNNRNVIVTALAFEQQMPVTSSDTLLPGSDDGGGRESEIFSTPGLYYWTCPPGVTCIKVECWGGGGRGGDVSTGVGGGGGGGAYSRSSLTSVPGTTYALSVGQGSTTTSAGGDSWFGTSPTLVRARGGNSGINSYLGASGGSAALGIGTVKYNGGNGGNAIPSFGYSGGGGGGAGSSGAGGNAVNNIGGAGTPLYGGNGGNGLTSPGPGNPGSNYGGGGGGEKYTSFPVSFPGIGAGGLVIISYISDYYNITPFNSTFCFGTTVTIGLSGSETGVSYQLYLGGSPLGSPVAGTGGPITFGNYTAVGTYTVVASLENSTCTSTMNGSVVIAPVPTIVLGTNPVVCPGSTTASLTYSGPTGNPNQYMIDWDAAAEAQGFADLPWTALPASPILLILPGTAPPSTYYAILNVRNSSSGCESADYDISVTIGDFQDPVITCPAPSNPYNTDPGECNATLSFAASATDNCDADVVIEYTIDGDIIAFPFDFLPGTTTVVAIARDDASPPNEDTCSFQVIVVDDEPPGMTCPPNISQTAGTGVCYAVITDLGSPVVSDNCTATGDLLVSNNAPADDQYPVGINSVIWTVEDESGNISTCEQTIIVTDTISPVILNCPADLTVYTGPGRLTCNQVASWTPPSASDNCGDVSLISDYDPGDLFPVGITTVTYIATDSSGNQAVCEFAVQVIDNTVPTFTRPGDITIYVNSSCNFNSSVSITGDVTNEFDNCTPTGLQAIYTDDSVAGPCYGNWVVYRTWTLTDLYGNITSKVQTITVMDNILPVLTVPPTKIIECDESSNPSNTGQATATDNCGEIDTITYTDVIIPLSCPSEHNIVRTWKARDCSGNEKTGNQLIMVRDETNPYIVFIAHDTVLCPADVPGPDPSVIFAQDNCGDIDSIIFITEIPYGLEGQPGYCPDSIHRIYRITDLCGNAILATQRIIILDECDCSPCADTLSFHVVDLDGQPNGDTTLYDVQRFDKCCNATSEYCASFNVRLDEDAVGVIITVDGAAPSPHDWKIDCDDVEIHGDTICMPGGDFHLFTYCKPGHNENDFRFQSIGGVILAGEITTRVNCETQLQVEGIDTLLEWNSVYPGYYGQYNLYLSCTNCPNPIFTPDTLSPPEIHYKVCGGINSGSCDDTGASCDTLVVHVLDSIYIVFNVDPASYCHDEIPLICATVYPEDTYTYKWYEGYDSAGVVLGTAPCFLPPDPGAYSLVVKSTGVEIPCSIYLYNFDVAPDNDPPIVYPPGDLFLECGDPLNQQLIIDWLALAYAIDDHTPDLYVENNFNGISEFCNSVVEVLFWATDSCENTGTATASITILDTQPPSIVCPEDITIQVDPVNCDVEDPDIGWAEATDGCPGPIDISNDAPPAFPPGITIVRWIAIDACNNADTCYQAVTIADTIPPSVICPDTVTVNTDPGACSAYVVVPPPVVTDPCPYTMVNDYTGTDDASGIYPIGETEVTWTITGVSSNHTYCTQVISVIDDQAPSITCPGDIVAMAEPPECLVPDIVLDLPDTADNCPGAILTWTASGATTGSGTGFVSIDTFNVGVTVITYTLTDLSGNFDTCSFSVTVNDDVQPTIIECVEDLYAYADEGECDTYIEVPLPIAVDSCGETISITHNSPYGIDSTNASGTYPVGIHTITWKFTDESNNSVYCDHLITVIDDQLPVITCPGDTSFTAEPPLCEIPGIVLGVPDTSDNCPGSTLSWVMTGATPGSGTGFVDITTFNVGVTLITYILADASGNRDSCSFTVTVFDQVPPTIIECPENIIEYAGPDSCIAYVVVPGPIATDPCGEIVTYFNNSPYATDSTNASGYYPVGLHLVVWTFIDESNNMDTCQQIISVIDAQSPYITCPGDVSAIAAPPDCYAPGVVLDYPDFGDNCSDVALTWAMTGATIGAGSGYVDITTFNVGVTYITYTASDTSGNSDTCTFTVTVNDQVPPAVISCSPDTIVNAPPDSCAAYVSVPPPEAIDPCGEIVTFWHNSAYSTDSSNSSGVYPVGVHTVVWIFMDESGNSDTCIQIIQVQDVTGPLLICPDSLEWPADYNLPYATNVPVDPPVYSDACGITTLTWEMTGATTGSSPPSGINELTLADTLYVGVTTITYTAVDTYGNVSTCSFTINIISKPEIICPADTTIFTDPGVCTASLDPGFPTKVSGIEPIEWTWFMTGATVDSGSGIPILPNPYSFNLGVTYIMWIATNVSGSDTCYQTITVSDNQAPSFETPGPFEFCVYDIYTAIYDGQPEPFADFVPERPDWYIVDGTPELDLENLADNCCDPDSLNISWIINYSNGYPAISGTGQPSLYGPITLWGTTDHTVVVHTITYTVEDCHGNITAPLTVDITIKPRPYLSKPY